MQTEAHHDVQSHDTFLLIACSHETAEVWVVWTSRMFTPCSFNLSSKDLTAKPDLN